MIKRQNGDSFNFAAVISAAAKAFLVSAILLILMLLIFSLILSRASNGLGFLNTSAVIIYLVCSCVFSIIIAGRVGRAGIPTGLVSGCIFASLLLLFGFIFYGGAISGAGILFACCGGGGIIGGILGVRKGAKS